MSKTSVTLNCVGLGANIAACIADIQKKADNFFGQTDSPGKINLGVAEVESWTQDGTILLCSLPASVTMLVEV